MTKLIWMRCQLLVFSPVTRVDLLWLMAFLGRGGGGLTTEFFWRIRVEADKESSGKVSPAFAVSQVPTAQNNRYTKVAYFGGGVACSELLWSCFGGIPAALQSLS